MKKSLTLTVKGIICPKLNFSYHNSRLAEKTKLKNPLSKCLFVLLVFSLFNANLMAQTTTVSATWLGSSQTSTSPTLVGSSTLNSTTTAAPTITGMYNQAYVSGAALKMQRQNATNWWIGDGSTATVNSTFTGIAAAPASNTTTTATTSIDFKIAPATGFNLTVTGLSMSIKSNNSSSVSMTYCLGYSTDGTNFTKISTAASTTSTGATVSNTNDITISTANATLTTSVASQTISVPAGSTLTFRAIMWRKTSSASTSTSMDISNVVINGTTSYLTPTAQPTSAAFTNVGSVGLTANWTNGTGTGTNSLAVVYPHNATPTTPSGTYTANTVYGSGSAIGTGLNTGYVVYNGTSNTVSVTGLTANTSYDVYVYSFNGTSTYYTTSPLVMNQSTTVASINDPSAFTASAASTSSISLSSTANATPDNVMIAVNTTNVFGTPTGTYSVSNSISGGGTVVYNGTAGSATFSTSTTPNTIYYFKAWSVSGSTYSSGILANATTLPNAPTITAVSTFASTSLSANWTAPTSQGSEAFTYTVEASTDNTFATGVVSNTSIASSNLTSSVTSLTPQTLYYFRVKAVNAGGSSAYSSTVSAYTTSSAPTSRGANFYVIEKTTTSFALEFGNASNFPATNAVKSGYLVLYSTGTPAVIASPNGLAPASVISNGTQIAVTEATLPAVPTATGVTVNSLTAGSTYNVIIVPYTWDGVNTATYNYLATSPLSASVTLKSAVAIWDMNATNQGTPLTIGNVNATAPAFTTYGYRAYSDANFLQTSYGSSAGSWNADGSSTTTNATFTGVSGTVTDTRYIDFTISPQSGSTLSVTNIVVPIKSNNSSSASHVYSLAYSTDGTNFTKFSNTTLSTITATGSTISGSDVKISTANSVITTSYNSTPITVSAGKTLTLRAILWRGTTSSSSNTTMDFQPMYISGSTSVVAPTAQVTGLSSNGIADQSFGLSWTKASDASNTLVVVYPTGASPVAPSNISYTATGTYSTGSTLGTGKVLYNGSASSCSVSGVSATTTYDVYVYEFNTDGSSYQYYTTSPATVNVTTTAAASPQPTNYPTAFAAGTKTSTSITLNWTDAIGAQLPENYLVVLSTSAITDPTDGVALSDGTVSGVIYKNVAYGAQTTTITGLSAQTNYNIAIYPYTNAGTAIDYKTDGTNPAFTAYTYTTAPTAQPYTFDVVPASSSSINLNWVGTTGAGGYLLVRSTSSNPIVSGYTNGIAPSSQTLGSGVSLVTDITSGSTTSYPNTALTLSTKYYYTLVPYTWDGSHAATYNYLVASALSGSATVVNAISTYSFTSTGTPTNTTGIVATTPTFTGYTSPSYSNGLIVSPDGAGNWTSDGASSTTSTAYTGVANTPSSAATTVTTRHIDFTVAPAAGYNLSISQITIPIKSSSAFNSINYSLAYSTDNTTWTRVSSSALSTISSAGSLITNTYDIQVNTPGSTVTTTFVPSSPISIANANTLYVRVIIWSKATVTRASTTAVLGTVVFAGTATALPTPAITSSLTDNASVGIADSYTITASNGPIVSYSASGYPSFMTFDSNTGIFTVSASSTQGTYPINIAANNGSSTGTATLVYTVNSSTTPAITSLLTSSAIVGQPYSYQIAATNSPTSYSASGLPSGLSINTSNGMISGTPLTSGATNVTITATNSTASASKTLVITTTAATYYYYGGTGALDNYSNWYASNGSSSASAVAASSSSVFTQSSTTFEIRSNASTSSNSGTWTVSGSGSKVIVGNSSITGKTLTIASGKSIVATIDVAASASGTNTLLLQDATLPTFGTINSGSTIEYGASVAQTITNITYGNLTISNTSATGATTANATSSSIPVATVSGTLTVSSGGTLTFTSNATYTTKITVASSIIINGSVNFPGANTIYFDGAANLFVNSGATLYIGSSNGIGATSNGCIRTTGATRYYDPNNVSYVFQNTSATSVSTGVGFPSTAANVTVNVTAASAVLTLSQALDITGKLTVNAGTLATGNVLTLKSTSISNTAIVANVCPSCAITGKTIVERYIPAGYRAYRDIAPEVYNSSSSSTRSMYKNWQENGSFTNGTGIFITGPSATDAVASHYTSGQLAPDANGLDYSINGVTSAYSYTNGSGYNAGFNSITNTTTTNLDAFSGYRVLVRGDRSFNLATTPIVNYYGIGLRMVNATRLRTTGNLVYGTITYNASGVTGAANGGAVSSTNGLTSSTTNGFSMVANPYVCPVYWGSSSNDQATSVFGLSTNINGSYWYFDPTAGSTGKYVAFNALTGGAVVLGSTYPGSYNGSTTGTGYIQPGQAFFVQNSSSSPSVVFTEACKATSPTTRLTSIFGANKPLSKIYLGLKKEDSTNVYVRKDGAAIAFAAGFTNTTYGPQDALKFGAGNDNLSITDKGKNLSIDGRLPATATDVLPIALNKMTGKNYQLVIDATTYDATGYIPVLKDNYRGTVKELALDVNTISFTVDTSIAASYANRFSLGFKVTTLAVNSIVASATLNNKIATISWNTVGEKGVSRFEVEKSADAKNFTKIGQASAKNTSTAKYTTTDNSVTTTTYYRIKAISEVGTVSYSNVAQLTVNSKQFTVYPNPLVGKTLNVTFGTIAAGKYTVTINNVLGQRVQEVAISHAGGNGSHAITGNSTLAKGTYSVTIRESSSGTIVNQSNLSVN